jgi:hypothetical protein
MTEAEKRKRDIEGKFDSIRLSWKEAAGTLDAKELADIRAEIERHLADLQALLGERP